jgi:hypothetical protein
MDDAKKEARLSASRRERRNAVTSKAMLPMAKSDVTS